MPTYLIEKFPSYRQSQQIVTALIKDQNATNFERHGVDYFGSISDLNSYHKMYSANWSLFLQIFLHSNFRRSKFFEQNIFSNPNLHYCWTQITRVLLIKQWHEGSVFIQWEEQLWLVQMLCYCFYTNQGNSYLVKNTEPSCLYLIKSTV